MLSNLEQTRHWFSPFNADCGASIRRPGNGVVRALGVDAGLVPAVMKNGQRTS